MYLGRKYVLWFARRYLHSCNVNAKPLTFHHNMENTETVNNLFLYHCGENFTMGLKGWIPFNKHVPSEEVACKSYAIGFWTLVWVDEGYGCLDSSLAQVYSILW